jgi:hypothetical protein
MQNTSGKPGKTPIVAAERKHKATRGQRVLHSSSSGRDKTAAAMV